MEYSENKLRYLRKRTILSLPAVMSLKIKEKSGMSVQELLELEYKMRLDIYSRGWKKTWERLNWGDKENESLESFAEGALVQNMLAEEERNR